MRFSVDAHAIGRNLTGNEVYVRNLLKGFAALDQTSDFIAYVSETGSEAYVPQRFQCRRVAGNPFVRLGVDLPRLLREDRPDLIHVQYTAPLNCPVPVVVSVHDVSFLEHPEYFPHTRALQLRYTVKRTVQRAARILCPSEFSAQAVRKAYGLDESNVTVVHNGVSSQFRPISREHAQASLRARLGIPCPYVLMVGDLQPRKNQTGLMEAFEQLIRQHPSLPHHLVLAGQDSWYAARVKQRAAKSAIASRIRFTGFVTDDQLLELYGGCDAFVFPSFYEGFGIPILEAMACGRAVACSNTTAAVEVADGAALVFDPTSTAEMTRALRDLLLDTELRTRMERLGTQRANAFQWNDAAAKTLDIYHAVAELKQSAAKIRPGAVVARR
ncbi:MAG: glycosyltransferase family 4 protein [Acidobacteriia bacterium]|nr:glycosyltransferase family 4 protein [Terriglobia bacterium]